jgi:arylsulfatase A-like enzyme
MSRRLTALVLLLLLPAACGRGPAPVFGEGPRRIIVISLDTLSAAHVGCYGYDRPTSPRLDALAAHGVRFARATAPSNWTLPSHASLFTGLYPQRHGVVNEHQALDETPEHLVERLRQAGFATAAFTGGGFVSARHGLDQGFDHFGEADDAEKVFDRTLAEAGDWLVEHRDRDVFLFLHTYEIHMPYTPPREVVKRFLRDPRSPFRGLTVQIQQMLKNERLRPIDVEPVVDHYDAGIAHADALLGGFLDRLATEGLDTNLLLVVASDHGEEFWEHGSHGHNDDRLGGEVTDVPLIVTLPGGAGAGRVPADEASFLDVLPTVLDAAGIDRPAGLDGYSLMPDLADWPVADVDAVPRARRRVHPNTPEHGTGICEGRHLAAVRSWRWKGIAPLPGSDAPTVPSRLYDLAADPGELAPLPWEGAAADLLGGALDRLLGAGAGERHAPPSADGMDEATRRQLEALGYI